MLSTRTRTSIAAFRSRGRSSGSCGCAARSRWDGERPRSPSGACSRPATASSAWGSAMTPRWCRWTSPSSISARSGTPRSSASPRRCSRSSRPRTSTGKPCRSPALPGGRPPAGGHGRAGARSGGVLPGGSDGPIASVSGALSLTPLAPSPIALPPTGRGGNVVPPRHGLRTFPTGTIMCSSAVTGIRNSLCHDEPLAGFAERMAKSPRSEGAHRSRGYL